MTVIRPNSVSGITSITAQANEINFFRSNGTLAGLQLNGVNFNTTTGISTLAALKITGNLDVEGVLTYQDVTNVDSVGIITARQGVRVTADGSPSSNYISVGASNDLKIYHSGSHSRILDDATGKLQLGSDTEVEILNGSFNESMAKFQPNGAVELYHNNSKKFETSSDGAKFSGSALFPDNQRIKVGGDASTPDLQIWHDGSNTRMHHQGTGQFIIYGNDNDQVKLMKGCSEEGIILNNNGNVELYHNNVKKFETTFNGAKISGTTTAFLEITTTNGAYNPMFRGSNGDRTFDTGLRGDSGDAWCVYDVTATDNRFMIDTNGHILIPNDSKELRIGASADMKLYHDGSNNHILGTGDHGLIFGTNNSNKAFFRSNGNFVPWTNNAYDIGESGLRWRNIYTNDLNLSNEGGKNNVDGTWGNYTIQEGESDLFLINNRNGKKYKFNLTEVS